jgi:hypothetical protein
VSPLTAGDPEGLPGVALGVEVGGAGEGASRRLDPAEPREREGLDLALFGIAGQHIPVAVTGEQVQGVQAVPRNPPGEALIVRPHRFPAFDMARHLRPRFRVDPKSLLLGRQPVSEPSRTIWTMRRMR